MKRYVIKDFWHAFRQSENKKKIKSESSVAVFLRSFCRICHKTITVILKNVKN